MGMQCSYRKTRGSPRSQRLSARLSPRARVALDYPARHRWRCEWPPAPLAAQLQHAWLGQAFGCAAGMASPPWQPLLRAPASWQHAKHSLCLCRSRAEGGEACGVTGKGSGGQCFTLRPICAEFCAQLTQGAQQATVLATRQAGQVGPHGVRAAGCVLRLLPAARCMWRWLQLCMLTNTPFPSPTEASNAEIQRGVIRNSLSAGFARCQQLDLV